MMNDKKLFFPLIYSKKQMFLGVLYTVFLNISNYLLRNCSIQIVVVTNFVVISNVGIKRFDCNNNNNFSNMFLGVLNTVFLNISNYLSHLELKNRSIQIVVVTNFVTISNVGIKRFDCSSYHAGQLYHSFRNISGLFISTSGDC